MADDKVKTTTHSSPNDQLRRARAGGEASRPHTPSSTAKETVTPASGFVAPSSYLRPVADSQPAGGEAKAATQVAKRRPYAVMGAPVHPLDREQVDGL
ncbi:hypothetical protein LTR95_019010, partial [Oleoguttula sp. CCFEE 5521]